MNKEPKKLLNGHIETLTPHFLRKVKQLGYVRQRIETPDNDFIDLDWHKTGNDKLVILSHGLESSSRAKYIQGMGDYLAQNGFDVLAWNCRGCSGELNKKPFYYHSGVSWDLKTVIEAVNRDNDYKEIYLVGFSMGANITLKYMGEYASALASNIKASCVFSAPCNLEHSSKQLERGFSKIYTNNFLKTLFDKVDAKKELILKHNIDLKNISKIKNLNDFDELITAPLNGFKDAKDYYEKNSSIKYMSAINRPTLIVNALNDPFLAGDCYPKEKFSDHKNISLFFPRTGGHCGFMGNSVNGVYWSEHQALNFFTRL